MSTEVSSIARNSCLSPNGSYISPNSHSNPNSPHSELFKNKEKNIKELRRRRSETIVELRKQKKDNNIERRRRVFDEFSFEENWCDDNGEQENILSADEIIGFIKSCNNIDDLPAKYVKEARRILSLESEDGNDSLRSQAFINTLLSDEVMRKLVKCLVSECISISSLIELVSLFSQLSSDNNNNVIHLIKSGAVINLMFLLSYDNCIVVEKSLISLANVVSSSVEARDKVLSDGLLARILPIIEAEYSISPSKYIDDRIHMVRAISWMLFVICQHRDSNAYDYVGILMPYFIKLLNFDDIDVKAHVLHALSTTTDRDSQAVDANNSLVIKVIESIICNDSLLTTIIGYLSPQNNLLVLYAIRVVGNIVSWDVSYAQIIIQTGALLKFNDLLKHQNANIQREAAFTLANITAGNSAQIESVIESNLIPSVVEMLYLGDYRTQIEASHVILNITSIGNESQALYVMNIRNDIPGMDIFDAMATMLTTPDAKVIETALRVYKNLMILSKKTGYKQLAVKKCESCAAYVHIDSLQHNRNSHISLLATSILEEFFSDDSLAEEYMMFHETANNQVLDKRMEISF